MLEIITTTDGSSSLYNSYFDETYHSRNGALAESMHVYIDAGYNYLRQRGDAEINIFEMGLGTGLNAILTFKQWKQLGKSTVNYKAIEKYPVPVEVASKLHYNGITDVPETADAYLAVHTCPWDSMCSLAAGFSLMKIEADIMTYEHTSSYNLVYYDAFAPSKQAEVWQYEILERLVDAMDSGGVLVTYCAKGAFKRMLKTFGLHIEVLPGPLGKKQITRAHK